MFSWLSFLTYAVITTITPGPNNIMSMSNGSRKGFKKALPFNFGIWTGFSAVMVLCAIFCSILSSVLPKIKLPMLIAGAAYMLYLAWHTFRSDGSIEENHAHDGFLSGVMLQFVNVKIIIYGVVSMEAYILPHFYGNIPALLGFALLLSTLGFASTLCWSAFGTVFKWLFAKHAKLVNLIMALLLVCCAASLFLS